MNRESEIRHDLQERAPLSNTQAPLATAEDYLNHGLMLRARGRTYDVDAAIEVLQAGVTLAAGKPIAARIRNALALAHLDRYLDSREMGELFAAVEQQRSAVEQADVGTPEHRTATSNLGIMLSNPYWWGAFVHIGPI